MHLVIQAQQQLNRDPQNIVDPTGFMRVLVPPIEVEGSALMFESWKTGDIYLTQGKYASEVIFNYDVMNHTLAVQMEGREYSLDPVAVDSIHVHESGNTLVNPILYGTLNIDLLLLRIYDSPHLSLFRRTAVEVIKPNYNELLDVGNRNFQIDQDFTYLVLEKEESKFVEIKGKRKELKSWEYGDKLNSFVKDQYLDLKSEPDLIKVLTYYEELRF
jgi:hypothetical protein